MRFSSPFVNYFGGLSLGGGSIHAADFGLTPAPVNMSLVRIKIILKIVNLERLVGHGKDMQNIDVHSEFKNCEVLAMDGLMPPEGRMPEAVTLLVMSKFLDLLGASRACMDFCDPTDFSRFNLP